MTRRMFTNGVRLGAGISHLTMYLIRIAVYILLQTVKDVSLGSENNILMGKLTYLLVI